MTLPEVRSYKVIPEARRCSLEVPRERCVLWNTHGSKLRLSLLGFLMQDLHAASPASTYSLGVARLARR